MNNSMNSADDCFEALHRAGWSLGEVALKLPDGRHVWYVNGTRGENVIRAQHPTQADAWRDAVDQARTMGALGTPAKQCHTGN
jgi:hypothetical protein